MSLKEEIENCQELSDIEIVQLWNLLPAQIEEAEKWIPSLEKLITEGKENEISKAINVLKKYNQSKYF